jgi:hypothetical protein
VAYLGVLAAEQSEGDAADADGSGGGADRGGGVDGEVEQCEERGHETEHADHPGAGDGEREQVLACRPAGAAGGMDDDDDRCAGRFGTALSVGGDVRGDDPRRVAVSHGEASFG